jgi:hypothetical protein
MGINPAQLSERQRAMIEPAAQRTDKRLRPSNNKLTERDIHAQFTGFCRRHGIIVWHSNPVRKSSIATGLPDFLCWRNGIAVAIEFKVGPNTLTSEQKHVFQAIKDAGNGDVHVCTETAPGTAYAAATAILKQTYATHRNPKHTDR